MKVLPNKVLYTPLYWSRMTSFWQRMKYLKETSITCLPEKVFNIQYIEFLDFKSGFPLDRIFRSNEIFRLTFFSSNCGRPSETKVFAWSLNFA